MCLCIVKAHFYCKNMLLNLHEFAFKGQNMKLTVNVLLTCILCCAPGPAAIRTVCKYSREALIMDHDHILFLRDFPREMP